jgi:hypothetical protein
MRHGWIVFQALLVVGMGFIIFETAGLGGEWSLPDGRLGTRTAPILLLSRPDVQVDLRLEPAQIAGARSTINELTRKAMALRGKSGPAVLAQRRVIDEAQTQWLGTNLSGKQRERLRQIDLQWEGPSAMISRPAVAEYLKLTPEQRQALAQAIARCNERRARGTWTPRDDEVLNDQAHSLLSQAQKELWGNLVGNPCRFDSIARSTRPRDQAAQQAGHIQNPR